MLEISFYTMFFLSSVSSKTNLCVPPYLHKASHEIAVDPSTHCNGHEISESEILSWLESIFALQFFLFVFNGKNSLCHLHQSHSSFKDVSQM